MIRKMVQDSRKNLLLLILVFLPCGIGPSDSAEKTIHLEYSMFQTLTRLVPEISSPRIPGALTEAGHQLWSRGELRLPAQGHLILADLNGDQRQEAALLLTDGSKSFLLIATLEDGSWKRKSLIPLRKEEMLNWDGKTLLVGPPESFLEWDGREFRLESGPLALYAHSYSADDFAGVSVKLTYVGEQHGQYPGLLISSYYRLADLDAFAKFHRKDVSYANDEMRAIWHLTMSPENLRQTVLAIKGLKTIEDAATRMGKQVGLSHSVSILDSYGALRPNYFEALITATELTWITRNVGAKLGMQDPTSEMLAKYSKMFVNENEPPGKDFHENEAHSQSRLADAISSAQKIHPAPNGKWELVVQSFWKNHLVLRLVSTSFGGWYHRPSIAVSLSGKATVLTDGVLRLPQSRIISSYNEIAVSENLHLNRKNIVSYASFFLSSHLLNGDFLYIQAPHDFRDASPEPTFSLREQNDAFLVETDLVNKKNGSRKRHRFMIRKNGVVTIDKNNQSSRNILMI